MTQTGSAALIDRTGQFPEGIGKTQPTTFAEQLESRRGWMQLSELAESTAPAKPPAASRTCTAQVADAGCISSRMRR